MANVYRQMLDDLLLDTFDNVVWLQKKDRESRARLAISMAKNEGIVKDTRGLGATVENSNKKTAHSKPKSGESDDIVDDDSGNLADHDHDSGDDSGKLPDHDSDSGDDSEDDYSNKENDHKNLLNDDEIPWKISMYPPPYRNLKRLVAWQIERQIQWIDYAHWLFEDDLIECRHNDKKSFCSTFHMRTAKDLKKGKPFKDGNLGIKIARTRVHQGTMSDDSDEELISCPWGRPAAALLVAARSHCNNPEDWMLLDEPRKLLIAMEKWYFELDRPNQRSLAKDAWDWTEIQATEHEKWDQAFSVCGCGKRKRCRMSRGESEETG